MAFHSSIRAWEIAWQRSLAGYSPWGHKESGMTQQINNNNKGGLNGTRKRKSCFDIEKHVPRLIVAMTTIFLRSSKIGTSYCLQEKKKKSCPCPRTSVPSYPCSLISHSHLSQTDVTVSVLLPSSQGHQTPTRLHHVTLVPHTICGHESQLLQAFLSILCLNWKLHEGRCFLSFTKQDMHLVNVHRTE